MNQASAPDNIPAQGPPPPPPGNFLGKWNVTLDSRSVTTPRTIRIEFDGSGYRLRSQDGRIDEILQFESTSCNLANERMVVSLWRDGSRLFGRELGTDAGVWGATEKLESFPSPIDPLPGPHRPDWRIGRHWKVALRTGRVTPPPPGVEVVIDPASDGWHPLRQVGHGAFDHLQLQDPNRTLDGRALRSVACWARQPSHLFAMVVLPPKTLVRLDAASDEKERRHLFADLGLLPFEHDALVRIVVPGGQEEGVAVWGADEG